MQNILLVEDSSDYQTLIRDALPNYQITLAGSAEQGLLELDRAKFDLILLDLHLPIRNGYSLLSEIQNKPETESIPVICITGKSAITDKIEAFTLGADDYIQKPFDILELRARVDSKIAKSIRSKESNRTIRLGNLKIDTDSHQVSLFENHKEKEITLTQTEYKLLCLFSKSPSKVLTREQILEAVWGDQITVSDRVIDVHLCALRRKIKNSSVKIIPVTGRGYRMDLTTNSNPSHAEHLSNF
jgi:DNA-binding response OmpR family regulator